MRFYLNAHTLGFHPQSPQLAINLDKYYKVKVPKEVLFEQSHQQNLELNTKIMKQYQVKLPLKRFRLNGHTLGFYPKTPKFKLQTKQIVPCGSTATELLFEQSHIMILSTDSKV